MPVVKVRTRAETIKVAKLVAWSRTPYGRMKARINGRKLVDSGSQMDGTIASMAWYKNSPHQAKEIWRRAREASAAWTRDNPDAARENARAGGRRNDELHPGEAGARLARRFAEFAESDPDAFGAHQRSAFAALLRKNPAHQRDAGRRGLCTRWHGRKKGEPLCAKCQAKRDAR